MGGMNSREELDSHPFDYCGECLRKFQHTLKFDVKKRFEKLV